MGRTDRRPPVTTQEHLMTTRPLITADTRRPTVQTAGRPACLTNRDADGRRYPAPFRWRPRATGSD